jgi:hypothetical protein
VKRRSLIAASLAGAFATAAHGEAAHQVTVPLTARTPSLSDAAPDKDGVRRMAILRGLDKITGRAIDISAPAGVAVRFGTLTITARYCYTVPPEEPPETAAFIQIDDGKPGTPAKRVFSGWMFASTPALNGLEHPVYDVWVITCKTQEPATGASPDAPAAAKAEPEPPAARRATPAPAPSP